MAAACAMSLLARLTPPTGVVGSDKKGRQLMTDREFALHLADEAGKELLRIRSEATSNEGLGDRGDMGAQRVLADLLAKYRPDDAVLSEEAPDSRDRLTADRVWIIDPVDGTRQYAKLDRSDWAVHVALWERTGPTSGELTVGVVAMPAVGVVHVTDDPAAVVPEQTGKLRVVLSGRGVPDFADELVRRLDGEIVRMGSAGVKGTTMLRGEADVYVHDRGHYEWDNAAPVAVAQSAGLHASRLDGSPMVYNQPDPIQNGLLICRKDMADRLLREIAALR